MHNGDVTVRVGADIVEWALDEAYVVKQRRSGEMVLLS